MSFREYKLNVPENDFMNGFRETKSLVERVMKGLVRLVGAVRIRVTIDAEMERIIQPFYPRDAGFRSTLKDLTSEQGIPALMTLVFNQIESSIERYNLEGMSGCRLARVKRVRVMVVKKS